MKILIVTLFIILIIGVAPAFAANSPANQQTVTSTAVKETNANINPASTDDGSGYINGYDADGNYIGNYTVVDSSNSTDTSDENNADELNDQQDDTNNPVVSSFNAPDIASENSSYVDESDDNGNDVQTDDDYTPVNESDVQDMSGNYSGELEISAPSDENDNLTDDNQSDDESYTSTEMDMEYNEPSDTDQLNESSDNVTELDYSNPAEPSDAQLSENGTISQIDTNIPTNREPLIVTIVNGLCGVVQTTLEGVGNVCTVLGNELETLL